MKASTCPVFFHTVPGVRARVATALLLVLLSVGHASAQAGSWAAMAPDPNGFWAQSVLAINGNVYVHGIQTDFVSQSSFVPRLSIYTASSNTWSLGASPGLIRANLSVAGIKGKMYVAGGCLMSDCRIGLTNALEIYDPVTNAWSNGAPMATARLGAASGVLEGKLYVTGGGLECGPCNLTNSTEVYDPDSNSWAWAPPLPTGRAGASAVVLNGLLYVIGGWSPAGYVGSVDVYDPATQQWSSRTASPILRAGAVAGVINGQIYVTAGFSDSGRLTATERYDPLSDSWTAEAPMPAPRGVAGGVVNGKLYVIGGYISTPVGFNDAYTPPAPPFAATVQPPINVNGTSVFNSSRGVVPVKFRLEVGGQGTCELPAATISVFRTGTGAPIAITESEYTTPSDTGAWFKNSGCQYEYNLGSSSLGAGVYLVHISIDGKIVGSGTFGLK
jgi:hypothetical protein